MSLRELKVGQNVEGFHCYIAALEERRTGKDEPYIVATLKDQKGEVKVNLWKTDLRTFQFKLKDTIVIKASVGEYGGKPQLNITGITKSDKSLGEFGRVSNFSTEEMFTILKHEHIAKVQDPFIKFLCEYLITGEPYKTMFCTAPAAKGVHHPWRGGLLEHVLGLCNLADSMYASHYLKYFPHMRMDLVKFGLMFHDWGKIAEYEYSTPDIKYSMRGALMHHMGIVCDQLTRYQVKYEELIKGDEGARSRVILQELLHIVYSHHGKIEWSSIMVPATPEALFVHLIDYTDAKMMHMQDLIAEGIEGDVPGMSKYSYMEKAAYKIPTELLKLKE